MFLKSMRKAYPLVRIKKLKLKLVSKKGKRKSKPYSSPSSPFPSALIGADTDDINTHHLLNNYYVPGTLQALYIHILVYSSHHPTGNSYYSLHLLVEK